MEHCLHGVFQPREYPVEENWTCINALCLECGKEFLYWEDRNETRLEALSK